VGNSAGSAVAGIVQMREKLTKDDVVVVLFHDHASRYMAKIFNDDWMRARGFLDDELTVRDILSKKTDRAFLQVEVGQTVRQALATMKSHDVSQLPVMRGDEMVGSLTENAVLSFLLANPLEHAECAVESLMGEPFPIVPTELPISKLGHYITRQVPAVVARDKAGVMHIVTDYDIVQSVG
jgi:cystathionine beta-synthase